MTSHSNNHKSILVIGATGETGLEIIRQLNQSETKTSIHALIRDPSKLTDQKVELVGFTEGNARNEHDIERALQASKADWIIICVGNGRSVTKNDIRQANAQATAKVLQSEPYQYVRVMVVSAAGAGNSKIIVGFGIGAMISHYLRHVLADHTRQEQAFASMMENRVTIVRPTGLTSNKPTGKLVTFADAVKSPSTKTDRADLAAWIVNKICGNNATLPNGGIVNVTSV